MAGHSGLAGSVTLVMELLLAEASIKDHATLGVDIVGAGSGVTCDVPAGKTVLGYPAVEARDANGQF
jgi:UDP-3-O-[3-hydroxymyristoyl] glucosamine N-acyltransferase